MEILFFFNIPKHPFKKPDFVRNDSRYFILGSRNYRQLSVKAASIPAEWKKKIYYR